MFELPPTLQAEGGGTASLCRRSFTAFFSTWLRHFFDCASEILRLASLFLRFGFGKGMLCGLIFYLRVSAFCGLFRRNPEQFSKQGYGVAENDWDLPQICLPAGRICKPENIHSMAKLCQIASNCAIFWLIPIRSSYLCCTGFQKII